MISVTVQLDPECLSRVDRFIQLGIVESRSDAIRAALASWLDAQREEEIVATYRRAYREPQHDHELDAWAEHGTSSLRTWSRNEGDDVSDLLP